MQVTGSPREHTGEAAKSAAPKTPPKVPSWGPVLANTIRLWWQRRLRDLRRPWRALLAAVCVLAVAAVAVAVVTLTSTSTRTARSSAPAARPSAPASSRPAQAPKAQAQRASAAAAAQAAAWTATQLTGSQTITCDPGMCTALADHAVARARLRPLAATAPGATLPAGSVIAASPAADAGLGQDAPVLLASFGSGASEVQVRAAYPGGAAAYQAALRSDQAARRSAGTQLLHSGRIQAAASQIAQLRAGQVDSRVLVMLALLASQRSWRVVAFGADSPGVPSAAAPFRQVILVSAGGQGANGPGAAAALAGALALVRGQHGAYRAAQAATVRLAGGQAGLRIDFAAPSPLGLLAGASG